MKRYLSVLACLLVCAGWAGAGPLTTGIQLGINGASTTWNWNHPGSGWPLGVSETAGGPLISDPFEEGVYYLYAGNERFDIGNVNIQIWATDIDPDTDLPVDFHFNTTFLNITGTAGTFGLWEVSYTEDYDGFGHLPTIWLGWAQGTADLMGPGIGPDGLNDIYLVLGINEEPTAPGGGGVPEPGTLAALGSGLLAIAAFRKKL